MPLHRPFAVTLLALMLPATIAAQTPSVEAIARTAQELTQRVVQLKDQVDADENARADLNAAQAELDAFVRKLGQMEGLTVEHFVQASAPLLETLPERCVSVCEAGLRHHTDARFLHDNLGFARLTLAAQRSPDAGQTTLAQQAAASFRQALKCQPETFHSHLGLSQALHLLGQGEEALQQFELCLQDADGRSALADAWDLRASLLLGGGKPQDALDLLSPMVSSAADPIPLRILTLRAKALLGDAAAVQKAADALRDAESSPRTLIEAADALAFVGKTKEALALLAQRPAIGKWHDEDERLAQLYAQTGAAMEAFWQAKDVSTTPFRAALTQALDHHILVMEAGAKGKQTDLAGSPVLMAQMLLTMPAEAIKDWGNHLLFVLCVRAAPSHEPSALEQQMAVVYAGKPQPGLDDVPARLAALRRDVGDVDAAGGLTGLRAAEKLAAKAK
jgi:tetratricopeptide (TPR) repeat protein